MYDEVATVGLLRAGERWLRPSRLRHWSECEPDRYVMKLPLAPRMLLTCSPEDSRAIFTDRSGTLLFGEGLRRFAPHEAMFGHDALSVLDGEEHTKFRRKLSSAFHGEALRGYEAGIESATERGVRDWPVGTETQLAPLMHALARDVIAATVFGVTDPERFARLQRALDGFDRALNSVQLAARFALAIAMRGRWAPFARMQAIQDEIEAITKEEIAVRRASPAVHRHDCLARFLELEGEMSDDEIAAVMRVLVIAGWATSAVTLAWLGERLTRHPAALERCTAEARDGGGTEYIDAAVIETLRMRPPVPVTLRYVARDFDLLGLAIPARTLIAVDIERMHHRADVYVDPHAFRPERFLTTRAGTYTWLPFGGGVHRCIGAGFAQVEARVILTTMLRRRRLATVAARGEPSSRTTLITAPARGARVTLLPV
jgi:cytochrome P450